MSDARSGPFVCPWCAGSFVTRRDLADHWAANPECSRNRTVSNGTQSKYRDRVFDETGLVELLPEQPGQPVLDLVAERARRRPAE